MKTAKMKNSGKKTPGPKPKNGCRPAGDGWRFRPLEKTSAADAPVPRMVAADTASRARMLAVFELLMAVCGPVDVPYEHIHEMGVYLRDPEVLRKVSALALRVVIADGEARLKQGGQG
jgi:hypothetical protein